MTQDPYGPYRGSDDPAAPWPEFVHPKTPKPGQWWKKKRVTPRRGKRKSR